MKTDKANANSDLRAVGHWANIVDLGLFLATMFLIRTIYVPGVGYMGNVLINSLTTVAVATWLLHLRGESWRSLGLRRPESLVKMVGVVTFTLGLVIVSIIFFEAVISQYLPASASNDSIAERPDSRFHGVEGNIVYFFSIIFLVWLESALEELQDRAFLLTRLERLFSFTPLSLVLAVIGQAVIFGFRHSPSHGTSGAITTGIIGLVFGIAYVAFGRNLWALIIAHCFLNSISMIERFLGAE